ncbi:hypothetical protein BH24BAC1_BH24BAC1_33090 [soil metagenome]
MLFDAGEKFLPQGKEFEYFPLTPHDSLSASAWLVHYIRQVMPTGRVPEIDYAVISHFHVDHYGQIGSNSAYSKKGDYQLSGITHVGEFVPIKKLIDRGYPHYNYPVDLKSFYRGNKTFSNYLNFVGIQKQTQGLEAEGLIAGSKDQIHLKLNPKKYRSFEVRNIKANASIWTGKGSETREHAFNPPLVNKEGKFDENPLSLVLKISYGPFDYYTGGDLTGYDDYPDFDMETPVAKVVGKVEALALNHHGYFDATNPFFLQTLAPEVVIHQSIHDPHYQASVLERLHAHDFDIFSFDMHESTRQAYPQEVAKLYKSTKGHILLRVMPGGKEYYVFILDDTNPILSIKNHFGPYRAW